MDRYDELAAIVPKSGIPVDWDLIIGGSLGSYMRKMGETRQNPVWHGEGDVLSHTKMVCESLISSETWLECPRFEQEALFIAALLHDIGKTVCTREEDGVIVSPNHTGVGARMAREILWQVFGISGTSEAQNFRETVCALIKNHSIPFHFYNDPSPERSAVKIAANGGLAPGFSNKLLSALVEADIRGRIADETTERLQHVGFFRELSEELGCYTQPFAFPSAFGRYAYLSGRGVTLGQDLYDETWGTVTVMSGLPGTGKDTFIKKTCTELPVVSLDEIRRSMKIRPNEPQGEVAAAARELARTYLRRKQPFVWNATNLTQSLRQKVLRLLLDYNASVRVVFLETAWDTGLKRNSGRANAVPESVISDMLSKLVPPSLDEAHDVEWVIT